MILLKIDPSTLDKLPFDELMRQVWESLVHVTEGIGRVALWVADGLPSIGGIQL